MGTSICDCILSFHTQQQQVVKMGKRTSSCITVNSPPQGCILITLLFSLLTYDYAASHTSNEIIKYADDTTVVGLIKDEDDAAYRMEVEWLTTWCRIHSLLLNVSKTKEMVIDFRKNSRPAHSPLIIDVVVVQWAHSIEFLGVHMAEDLSFTTNTVAITKKAQQILHLLRKLRRVDLPTVYLSHLLQGHSGEHPHPQSHLLVW